MTRQSFYKTVPDFQPCDVLAFDPGLTVGWAAFGKDGYPFAIGEIKDTYGLKQATLENLIFWLAKLKNKPRVIVCEDFIIEPSNKLNGQRVIASEAIGVIRTYAALKEIELVMSPRTNLSRGLTRARITMPKDHAKTHVPSAIAHGTFYVTEQEIRPILPESSGYVQVSLKNLKRKDPLS